MQKFHAIVKITCLQQFISKSFQNPQECTEVTKQTNKQIQPLLE